MPIAQFFTSLFSHQPSKTNCQPTHQQRHQNEKFTEQLQSVDLQSIRLLHGHIDPRFQTVIQQSNLQSAYRVQQSMQQIRLLLQRVDNYCTKQSNSSKFSDKRECIEQMDGEILEKFQKPFIMSQLNLYKVANGCLVKGETVGECVEQVKRENLKSLEEGVKGLRGLVEKKCK